MAPRKSSIYRIYHPGTRRFSSLKITVKFLSFCQDNQIHKDILSRAPPNVIKGICNAALNCQSGTVPLSKAQKQVLRRHRKIINTLVQKEVPLERKRQVLVQHGGGIAAAIIPIILSTVLGALGSNIFKK
jgi:hypothetical protein